ncbi:MAG TPA: deoxyhypusine synthase [Methanomicrobiales archaeon]|nr:deoxyhypusine synthase [Methanomicrobiales archaeon]
MEGDAVKQVKVRPGMTVGELVRELEASGAFNGGSLAKAARITEEMFRDDKATTFVGLAGAMVPAGMGGIVSDLIDRGYVDVLVSTGANLVHDIVEAIGCTHHHGSADCSDNDLRRQGINRIYDVYVADEAFTRFEDFVQGIFGGLADGTVISTTELLAMVGKKLPSGILATAARKGVPVYCPAVQDSVFGLQFSLFTQTHKVVLDAFRDMKAFLDLCYNAERAGALIIGGGVPKNFIFQGMLLAPHGFTWAVQLTGDRPDLGGLSGATLDEARSWGKLTAEAQGVTVYGDATITLPVIAAAVLERISRG